MRFIGGGEVIEVVMIGVGVAGFHVVTIGEGEIEVNEATFWIGDEGTVYVMIGIGMGAANFAISGAFFVVISSVFLGSQKKVNSESDFGCGDEVISFISSASGFQKKDRSETDFVRGITGEEMTFLGGPIQSFTTCCIGVSWEGTDEVVIFFAGKAFSMMTS